MGKYLYHQSQKTDDVIFTAHCFDENNHEIGSPHFHKSYEILFGINGVVKVSLDDGQYSLCEGEAVIIQPCRVHSLTLLDGARVWCSTFTERACKSLDGILSGKIPANPIFVPSKRAADYFIATLNDCVGMQTGGHRTLSQAGELAVKSALYAVAADMLEKVELVPVSNAVQTVAVDVMLFVADNFKREVTLLDLAKSKGYNYQYLSRTFNKVFGINFKKMLNQYRINHALALLRETDEQVSRIAAESGFQSVRSFNHVCQEILGKTPKEIRNETK